MKYIKSTTGRTYKIVGIKIPECVTPNNEYAEVTEEQYTLFSKNVVAMSLVASGGLLVLDHKPDAATSTAASISNANAALVAKNTELTAQLSEMQQRMDAYQTGSQSSRVAELENDVAAKQADLDEALQAIELLKAQLADAPKSKSNK